MLVVTTILAAGVVLGFVFKNRRRFIDITERTAPWIVWALLLFLGIAVGTNETVAGGLMKIGIQASMISVGGVAGSICLAVPLHRLLSPTGRL